LARYRSITEHGARLVDVLETTLMLGKVTKLSLTDILKKMGVPGKLITILIHQLEIDDTLFKVHMFQSPNDRDTALSRYCKGKEPDHNVQVADWEIQYHCKDRSDE
jgi:hypothetical protein